MPNEIESLGAQIGAQWAVLPPEHLRVALAALEPQLAREHDYRLRQLKAQTEQDQRSDALTRRGQNFGLVIALAMLAAAVVVAFDRMQILAAIFAGPGLLALAKLFVLRKSDANDMNAVAAASRMISPGRDDDGQQ